MTFQTHEPEGRAAASAPYSSAVVSGDLVALSGQVPLTPDGTLVSDDFEQQAVQVFANLEACLEAAGCTFGDVFKVTGYLASLGDLATYNAVYLRYFKPPLPARVTVEAGLPGFKLEVEAWARKPA
jgi:2-iminobutanoate/2-iminopropanoate deaminase